MLFYVIPYALFVLFCLLILYSDFIYLQHYIIILHSKVEWKTIFPIFITFWFLFFFVEWLFNSIHVSSYLKFIYSNEKKIPIVKKEQKQKQEEHEFKKR